MREPLIVYHKNCMDGFTAAWVALRALPGSELVGMLYDDDVPAMELFHDRDVYVVDFSFKRDDCYRIESAAKSLKILDHHKTAKDELAGLSFAEFDMDRSGAGMTWDFFNPSTSRPWIVNYVEDRDLWRFKLPHSKEINAGIATTEMTIPAWTNLIKQGRDRAFSVGEGALAFESTLARKAAKTARTMYFAGYEVPFVNTQYALASVTAGLLAESAPFAVAWFQQANGTYKYSLRSHGDDSVDVSKIALQFNGGGHKGAAGFVSPHGPDKIVLL